MDVLEFQDQIEEGWFGLLVYLMGVNLIWFSSQGALLGLTFRISLNLHLKLVTDGKSGG